MLPAAVGRPTCCVCYAGAESLPHTCGQGHSFCKRCPVILQRSRSSGVCVTSVSCPWCQKDSFSSALIVKIPQGKKMQNSVSLPALLGPLGSSVTSSPQLPGPSISCKAQQRTHSGGRVRKTGVWRPKSSSGTLCISELVGRISNMTLAEVPHFVQHVTLLKAERLAAYSDVGLLAEAVKKRSAELFGQMPMQALSTAKTALALLTDRRDMFGGDCTPRRALETRVGYIAYRSEGKDGELDVLLQCYAYAADLERQGLVSSEIRALMTSRLQHWLEFAQLAQIQQQASPLRVAVSAEPTLLTKIRDRTIQRAVHNFGPGQLQPFIRLLSGLERYDLVSLNGRLDEALLLQLQKKVEHLVIEKLSAEIDGEVLELCRRRERIRSGLIPHVTCRVEREIAAILASLNRSEDTQRRKQTMMEWGKFVCRAGEAGLVVCDQAREKIVSDVLTNCIARCFDSKELSGPQNALKDLQQAQVVLRSRGEPIASDVVMCS